jgi:hypothetical protein
MPKQKNPVKLIAIKTIMAIVNLPALLISPARTSLRPRRKGYKVVIRELSKNTFSFPCSIKDLSFFTCAMIRNVNFSM